MRSRLAIVLGIGLVAACSGSGTGPAARGSEPIGVNSQGSATLHGVVSGFTTAPDTQLVAIAGATVTVTRVADLPTPAPTGGDTTITVGGSGPIDCDAGAVVASVTTGADGSWQAEGLDEGVYKVQATPPAGSGYRGAERCGIAVVAGEDNRLLWYVARVTP
jgi:hypothetical protein